MEKTNKSFGEKLKYLLLPRNRCTFGENDTDYGNINGKPVQGMWEETTARTIRHEILFSRM